MIKQLFFGLIGVFVIDVSYAVTLTINENGNSIGQNKQIVLKKGESLSTVARRYGVAVREVIAANPKIAAGKRLPAGTAVTVPIQYRLPTGPRNGIVLNLADLRIYYFHPDGVTVSTYPVAAGKQGWSTPQGDTTIVSKEKNPAWRPPKSIIREAARRGRSLPLVIPPGPHNPLGRYAMRLGIGGILIHGTNKPQSIGTRSSHGCIRMYAKDIEELFSLVPVGTEVHILSETKSQTAAKLAAMKAAAETAEVAIKETAAKEVVAKEAEIQAGAAPEAQAASTETAPHEITAPVAVEKQAAEKQNTTGTATDVPNNDATKNQLSTTEQEIKS